MFAVIKTGGKQYKVAAEDVITIEKLPAQAGDVVAFDQVLMVVADGATEVGSPTVAGATVAGEVVEQTRSQEVDLLQEAPPPELQAQEGPSPGPHGRPDHRDPDGWREARHDDAPRLARCALRPLRRVSGSSNLSLIAGIGPTIEKKLRAAGVTSWEQIAAWTRRGRRPASTRNSPCAAAWCREEWIEQAKELLDGKPPRAKADQAELASGKDL